ncbi:hypothetical protein [Ezakiella coagulans]|uniref:hypothetical protein n=1 Tax=Ezakiella coagulans TaxID=46507 RepID=UPI002014B45C|nr:hypothetical protein [Ezakiella coagulans]UQK60716.1 hypothetical protein M1R54_09455 [Ezakiella coagulans]
MSKISKKNKSIILLATIIVLIAVFCTVISGGVFRECNPLSVINGLIQVRILNKDYYEIQEYPKVMIANKDLNLVDYMKNLGWTYLETIDANKLVMENIYEFKYKEIEAFVEVIQHKNYYIWKWRE